MARLRAALFLLIAMGILAALVHSKAIESGEEETLFQDLVSGDLNEAIASEAKEEKSPIVKRSGAAEHIFPGQGMGKRHLKFSSIENCIKSETSK